ncbi:hypothetical protein RBU60_14110 [Mesonia sp. MT50]|uniref:Uncharacterized protein n=1 Tax=Mesonia profundi TaxID=3070998 RepID=A0ABU1A500_9FLAO|nr:hypothetical protein [Mesonia profundi]MDQ7918704.1 hypothetical protein [Mesonia profundi]
MKYIILILLLPLLTNSQTIKKDLYITYNDCWIQKGVEIELDTLRYEGYSIRLSKRQNPEFTLKVDNSGKLIKGMKYLSGKTYGSYEISYKNVNKNNPPFKIDLDTIINRVSAQRLIYTVDLDYDSFFESFRNIYLVNFNNKNENFHQAKKIKIKFIGTL